MNPISLATLILIFTISVAAARVLLDNATSIEAYPEGWPAHWIDSIAVARYGRPIETLPDS